MSAGNICNFSVPFQCTAPQMVAFDSVPSVTAGGPRLQCTLPDGSCTVERAGTCALKGGIVSPDSGSCPTVGLNTAVEMLGMLFSGGQRSMLEVLGAPGRDEGAGAAAGALPGFGTAGSGLIRPATTADFRHATAARVEEDGAAIHAIALHNHTDYEFPGVTVTEKSNVAGRPLRLAPGTKKYHMDMSSAPWRASNMVLTLNSGNDKHSVHLVNVPQQRVVTLSSTVERPVVVGVDHAPSTGTLSLTLKH